MTDGFWRLMPETRVSIDIEHLDSTGEIRMTKSKAPEAIEAVPAADAVELPPHDAARSNLPEPPAPPVRDYTAAKALWQKACAAAARAGVRPDSLGPLFVTDGSAPDVWERQSITTQGFWYELAER